MTRRSRRLLAAAAAVAALAPLAALGLPQPTQAASLDAFAVRGTGAGVRVTVQTGYSFVVEPDAMLPRADASIQADTVHAVASPLDPGDSVDALPGLGVPTAEQDIEWSASNGCCPAPFPTSLPLPPPPPQFGQAVGSAITTYVAPYNPLLTAPYEHAQATYPNGTSSSAQRAGFPPGTGDGVPPDFDDLNGVISAHSSTGTVLAEQGHGNARAGVGSAISVPALGLRVGRIDAQVDVRGGASGAVSQVTTTLHDVDLGTPSLPGVSLPSPPTGTSVLHIGLLVLTATTQRPAGADRATSQTSLEASGVTVAGVAARFDQNGLSLQGSPSPLNAVAQQIVGALNSPQCTPTPPISLPGLGSTTSTPSLRIGPPTLQDQVAHGGNEDTVGMTGPTLCIATTAPIPGSGGLAATPTIYTVTLGNLSSSAYGVSLPAGSSNLAFAPTVSDTGGASSVNAAGIDTGAATTTTTAPTVAPPPSTAPPPPAGRSLFATLTGGILSRRVVVLVALLAEAALLGTLWTSWLASRRPRPQPDESPTTRMDLL
ncbi:MAG TPA: hypothetical protein VN193_15805 [Candidatus Angelobacter sp.]|jgi:hypothetical protein|nr:hypothetical protein [Candidatus Angelobacter sp.]